MTAGARPLVEYMIRRTVARQDLSTVEGQSAAVASALPILEGLSDPVRRSEYGHLLADIAGVAESSVMLSLDQRLAGRPAEVAKTMKRATAQERVEREMLKLLARDAPMYAAFVERLTEDHFRSPSNRRAFMALREAHGDVAVLAAGDDDKLAAVASALALEPLDGDLTPEYAEGVWARVQEFLLKGKGDSLRAKLQKLNPTTDDTYDELFTELIGIDGELRRLRASDGA